MKQGILITAYKNFDQLFEMIQWFDKNFAIYIHIDKKRTLSKPMLSKIQSHPTVVMVSSEFSVNWGGINHLKSILHLASEGLKNPEIGTFHLITGQDHPIRSNAQFHEFFRKNRDSDFLENFKMPSKAWRNGGMDRIIYYNFYDVLNAKKNLALIQRLVRMQARLGLKRKLSKHLPPLYGGSTYWSLSRATLSYVIAYSRKDDLLLKRLKHTFCAEEIYFQTVVMNSENASRVVKNNLRFIIWEKRHGSIPAILDETDFDNIMEAEAFFIRKLEFPISSRLLEMVETHFADKD